MAVELTNDNFKAEVEDATTPVVIDVFATWCGPCQQMMPIFEELEKEFSSKYKFVKLNIDEAREVAVKYNVSSVPTFVFIKDGKVVGKESGYMNKNIFKEKMEGHLG